MIKAGLHHLRQGIWRANAHTSAVRCRSVGALEPTSCEATIIEQSVVPATGLPLWAAVSVLKHHRKAPMQLAWQLPYACDGSSEDDLMGKRKPLRGTDPPRPGWRPYGAVQNNSKRILSCTVHSARRAAFNTMRRHCSCIINHRLRSAACRSKRHACRSSWVRSAMWQQVVRRAGGSQEAGVMLQQQHGPHGLVLRSNECWNPRQLYDRWLACCSPAAEPNRFARSPSWQAQSKPRHPGALSARPELPTRSVKVLRGLARSPQPWQRWALPPPLPSALAALPEPLFSRARS